MSREARGLLGEVDIIIVKGDMVGVGVVVWWWGGRGRVGRIGGCLC